MKLYGHPMSTCTRKVLCLLAERGAKADFVMVDIMKGEGKKPDYLAVQPFGQVPALEDDGFVLYESRAILRYLDDKLPGDKLHGSDAKSRAMVEQWISVETSNFTVPAMKIIYAAFFGPMGGKPIDEAQLREGREGVERAAAVMERQLGKTPFLVGPKLSLADIGFMPYFEYIHAAKQGDVFDKFPNVKAWWSRVSERPSWKTATGKA